MRFFALLLIFSAVPLYAVNSQMQPMEDRIARYDAIYTNCDTVSAANSGQLVAILQLNPASDPGSLKMVCSALKRVRVLGLTNLKPMVRDLLDVVVDPSNPDTSSIPAQLRDVHYMGLLAYGAFAAEENDADVLYGYMKMRKLDNVGNYLVVRALGAMPKNSKAVKALNEILETLPRKNLRQADNAVVYAILDAVEKQGSKSSITSLFKIQSLVSANRDLYNRISELVATLSAEGN